MCKTVTYQVMLLLALSIIWLKASSEILRETYTCESKCICYNKSIDEQDERFVAECTNVKEKDLENLRNLPSNVTDLIIANSTLPTLHFASSIPTHFLKLLCVTFDGCNSTHILLTQQSYMYVNVQNITIRNNPIDTIREDTFRQFPNVQRINLDHNTFSNVHEGTFKDLNEVKFINISFNNIIKMEQGFFKNVPNLKLIDLSNNKLLEPISYEKNIPLILLDNEWPLRFYLIFYSTSTLLVLVLVVGAGTIIVLSNYVPAKSELTIVHNKNYTSVPFSDNQKAIGQILIDLNIRLGDNVWKGSLKDGREAAIKRSPKASGQSRKELNILLHMSRVHPNPHVVQYMCKEEDATYLYVALELFEMNLEEAITTNFIDKDMLDSCLQQLAVGLKHIHKQGVGHRDIKPSNILLKQTERGKIVFVISDFDLGHFEKEQSEHKKPYGTMGWAAPELWNGGVRKIAVDVFSLGCVFYYVLTKAHHPFGPIDNLRECKTSICYGTEKPKLDKLKKETKQEFKVILAKELIASMIERDPRKRPKARWIVRHPLFWIDKQISKFYHDIGNMAVDQKQTKFQSILRANSKEVYPGDWTSKLDEPVKNNVDKKFSKSDICKLLKTIRNKTEHFDELSEELKRTYYCGSEGVARYFNEKFPKLLLYTFQKKEELDQLNRN